ncbi:MAG: hypothetical protein Q9187_004590 [Circinaria calcarea]
MASECANPLLLGWIKEWLDEARERNSKGLTRKRPSNGNLPDDPLDLAPTKKPRKLKPYVPSLRSGPYAIILALATLAEDSSDGITKAQLIELAQPYCDSSFAAPSDPGKFYTAWNSHKTLLDKNLIFTWGRPLKKYTLTEEGWEVAKRIKNTTNGSLNSLGTSDAQDSTQVTRQEDELRGMHGAGHIVNLEDDGNHACARKQRTARADRESKQALGGLAVISTEQLLAELESRQAAASRQSQRARPPEPEFLELLSSPHTSPYEDDRLPWANKENLCSEGRTTRKSMDNPNRDDQQNHFPSFRPLRVAPGTFTIELVLDNREVRSKTDRDYIEGGLAKKGVHVIKRSLELGDALWVAKCKDPLLLARLGEEGDEIVLDYIVERKRLDDLVASIKDRRFHEQKFRLRRSGVKNVIYIIEEITLGQETAQKCHEMIESAIVSTQVLDGYFVKKTQKLDDTIRYLARMTVMLKDLYEVCLLPPSPTGDLDSMNKA